MNKLICAAILLVTLSLHGQGFGLLCGDLPYLAGSTNGSGGGGINTNGLLQGGIMHDWDASTTIGSVTDWVDSVQSYHMIKTNFTTSPQSDGIAVRFNGGIERSNCLLITNIDLDFSGGGAALNVGSIVMAVVQLDPVLTPVEMIIGNGGSSILIGVTETFPIPPYTTNWYNPANLSPIPPSTNLLDIIICCTNTGGGGTLGDMYTNGVKCVSNVYGTYSDPASVMRYVGNSSQGSGNQPTSWPFHGLMYRMLMWSNMPAQTAITVSNMHLYAKLKYGIAP